MRCAISERKESTKEPGNRDFEGLNELNLGGFAIVIMLTDIDYLKVIVQGKVLFYVF